MERDETTIRLRSPDCLRQYFQATGREYATGKNIKCPNAAAHAHGDANASAHIYENPDGALVKCYGCNGTWDIFALWQLDNGGSFPEAKRALCELCGIGTLTGSGERNKPSVCAKEEPTKPTRPSKEIAEYLTACALNLQAGADGEAGRAYMTERGISVGTARQYNIGYDAKHKTITIPQGAGYAARTTDPNAEQKDKCRYYPKGAPRVLFNADALKQAADNATPVFIVEGEFDALSIAEVGGIAVSCGGTGGIGKAIKAAAQIGRGTYAPCMDADEAGAKAQADIERRLADIGGGVIVFKGAPQILLPNAPEGTHPKDANEALQQDAAAFRARVAEAIGKAKEYAQAEEAKNRPYITLAEVPEPTDEAQNPRALFKRGYLRKGGGIIAASVAGAGKSTFSLQCALHWVLGAPCFGIEPVRPLKIAVIQAEDDIEELAMFRANMKQGLAAEGFTPDRIADALERVQIRTDFLGKTGEKFANALGTMQSQYHYDLVIVNPLNSYFDGDISLNKDATTFFRNLIDPVIKNPEVECGILFIHHMAKPAKGKDAAAFAKGAYAQYALQGGAELNNWARAVLLMTPFENATDYWTLTAAKRHKPLLWKDESGNPTKEKVIAYSDNCIYWREPSAEEIRAARSGTINKPTETDEQRKEREERETRHAIEVIAAYLKFSRPMTKTELDAWCRKNTDPVFKGWNSWTVKASSTYGIKKPCNIAYDLILQNPLAYGVMVHEEKSGNGKVVTTYGGEIPNELKQNAQAEADRVQRQTSDRTDGSETTNDNESTGS